MFVILCLVDKCHINFLVKKKDISGDTFQIDLSQSLQHNEQKYKANEINWQTNNLNPGEYK